MKKLSMALVLFLYSLGGICQNSNMLFNEDFDDNLREWPVRQDKDYARYIANGKIVIECRKKNYSWFWRRISSLEKKKNIIIETELTTTEFTAGFAGVMWGGDDDHKEMLCFMISPDGLWNFGEYAPKFESFTGTVKSEAIKTGLATNTIRVEKKGSTVRFFVNDVEVYSGKSPKTHGINTGLVSGGGAITVQADYFRVTDASN
jgi:hypothetical protein